MADTSMIELADLIEQRSGVHLGRTYGNGEKRTRKGPCPFCKSGTDRFAVFVNAVPQHYYCGIHGGSGCGAHGDAVTFLREFGGLSYVEACDELGIDPGSDYTRPSALKPDLLEQIYAPSNLWQEHAGMVVHMAQKVLWSKRGTAALEYLHQRGFTDETIRDAHLGYIPVDLATDRWYLESFEQWGLAAEQHAEKKGVWLYEGILIPWLISGKIWKLNVRRLSDLKPDDKKYLEIAGSSEGLYSVDTIIADKPVVLCESELDALSGKQEAGNMSAFVATGSISRARQVQWIARLCTASIVLIAYDDDKNNAGELSARYWLDILPNAVRWQPWAHDINEMLTEGKNIRAWLESGFTVAELEQEEAIHLPEQIVPSPALDITEAVELKPLSNRHPLVDDRMPEAFKVNTCPRCGRYGEAAFNLAMERWACICSQLETFDQAQAGKATRIPASDARPALAPVRVWNVKLNRRGVSDLCSQCGADATRYGHEAIAYCQKCWNKVEVPWIEQYRALTGQIVVSEEVAS